MAISLISSLILVWVISLVKVILQSKSELPSKDQLFAKGRDVKKRNILLVISHPDDESMFFTPTINFLTSRGDADQKGQIRKRELYHACAVLKVITFDNYGVSGHCNHQDVHYGVSKSLCAVSKGDIEAWELISTNIMRKYCGPVDIWLSMLLTMQNGSGMMHCVVNEHPYTSFLAMAQHASQWVCFRKLFVALSSYTYVNILKKIK